jgi:hypothetical protein
MKTTDHRARRGAAARRILGTGLALLAAVSAGAGPRARQDLAPTPVPRAEALASLRALDDAAARGLWPGFDPAAVPLALFDGENTLLRGYPSPPPEFSAVPGVAGLLLARGRHPAVTSNSTREMGGVRTATVIAVPGSPAQTMLALAEEVFHVFWLARHPMFRPNEMARYAYPFEDAGNLHALLAEDEALARALAASSPGESARWAAAALETRTSRLPALAEDVRAFEAALEMMEGTANFVARMAAGETPAGTAERLRRPRRADDVRWRFYDSGAALCFVLDRLSPGWQARTEREPALTTIDLLRRTLEEKPAEPAAFTPTESSALSAKASADVAELSKRRDQVRRGILDRPGPRIVIEVEAGAEPLRLRRFDPINLMVLAESEVAHASHLTLESAQGTVDVSNPRFVRGAFEGTVSLSVPAGSHPLTEGVRRLTIVGIEAVPEVGGDAGSVAVEAPGVRIRLRPASARAQGNLIRIVIRGGRP